MVQVKVDNETFEIENNTINGKELNWDLLDFKDGTFHIIKDNTSYRAMLLSADENKKEISLSINGSTYDISLKDKYDILLEKLGMSQMASNKINNVKAPMPGLVLEINVAIGDEVKKGDAVLILEAMKMENLIKAPGDATIKAINIKKGEAVEKNQVLIEFN